MKLTEKEAAVLAAIELRANMTIEAISAETGYRSHTVRHALNHLKLRQIMKRYPIINISALGYTIHNFMFSVESGRRSLRQELLRSFMQAPEVLHISELGSEYDFNLGICAKNISDVSKTLRKLTKKFENFLSRRALSTQFVTTHLPRRYLTDKILGSHPVQLLASKEIHDVDELDDRILRLLSTNAEASHPTIAKTLAIPLSTLELRIKKLEEKKIIAGYAYHVMPSEYKMQSHQIFIQTKRLSREILKKLYLFADNHPSVVSISECFGSWDFELELEVHQSEEVSELTHDLHETLDDEIHSVRALPKYRDLKFQSYPGIVKEEIQLAA